MFKLVSENEASHDYSNRNFGATLTGEYLNSEERLQELGGPEICDQLLRAAYGFFIILNGKGNALCNNARGNMKINKHSSVYITADQYVTSLFN